MTPIIGRSSCARMDADSGLWQSFSCEAQLPYVCEKLLNSTVELTGTFLTSSNKGLKIGFVKSSKSISDTCFPLSFTWYCQCRKVFDIDPVVRYYKLYMNKALSCYMLIRRQRYQWMLQPLMGTTQRRNLVDTPQPTDQPWYNQRWDDRVLYMAAYDAMPYTQHHLRSMSTPEFHWSWIKSNQSNL